MTGWVAITRDSFDHPAFKRSEVSETEAWHRLIARAAHAKTKHRIKSEVMEVERGSFFCTLRELQSEFMWRSDARVRNFLKLLENERMIERTANAGKTHVTICNYDEYQASERTENAQKTQARTQAERKPNALNNKETIKQKKEPPKSPKGDEVLATLVQAVSEPIATAFIQHRQEMKKRLTVTAAKAMVTKLANADNPDDCVNTSIANGWQGVFPERQQKPTHGRRSRETDQEKTYKILGIAPPKSRSRERLDA